MARVVVIGGGFGGLASALRLAKLGHEVTLVEERELGGALVPFARTTSPGTPPPTRCCPAVVRDLFRKTGRPLDRELELVPLDCLREHWFADGSRWCSRPGARRSTRRSRPWAPASATDGSSTSRRTPTTGR